MSICDYILEGGPPWGIRLQGGADYLTPLKIAQVTPGSKAEENGIVAGLEVLAINGNKTEYLSMSQAQTVIKVTGNELNLRLKDIEGSFPLAKSIIMDGGKPWGLRLQGGKDSGTQLRIGQITPGSKASHAGLEVGDQIISINDENTDQLTMVEAQHIIKETGDTLKLGIKQGPDDSNDTENGCEGTEETGEKKDPFLDELKQSMGDIYKSSGKTEAKGNTFKSLQEHTDAGLGNKVLTLFDMPTNERNKSIPILAPRVQKANEQNGPSEGPNPDKGREFTMVGGKPWGICLQGGTTTGSPLTIARVTASSKAYLVGLQIGDEIVSINDHDTRELTMVDAQNLIKMTGDKLKLNIKQLQEATVGAAKCKDEEIDEAFFEDLKISMQGCTGDRSGRGVKGNAFKKLQNIVDSGTIK